MKEIGLQNKSINVKKNFASEAESDFVNLKSNVFQINSAAVSRNSQANTSLGFYSNVVSEPKKIANILDKKLPNWAYSIRDIRQVGNIFAVTAAITFDGITREGLGISPDDTEKGIKNAESSALIEAAEKFGVMGDPNRNSSANRAVSTSVNLPSNPLAVSLMDLVTAKQLGIIRTISKETGINADKECESIFDCQTGELSREAATAFIEYLQNQAIQIPLRKAS